MPGSWPSVATVSAAAPPEPRLIAARVDGRPELAVSGLSDGELTLWRRGSAAAPPEALATFSADLDGSLWAADRQFLGWLLADDRALLDPGASAPEPDAEAAELLAFGRLRPQ